MGDFIELDGIYLLTLENYNLAKRSGKPDFSFHHQLEMSYVKSGTGLYLVDGRTYDMREGDVFIFNNIEPHAITDIYSAQGLVNMVVMFDPRFILSIDSNLFDSRYLKIFFDRSRLFQNRLDRDNPVTKDIGRLLLEIEEEFLVKSPEYELMIKVKLLNILVALIALMYVDLEYATQDEEQ